MTTERDLELLVRRTLTARAGTVDAGPSWPLDAVSEADVEVLDLIPPRQRHARTRRSRAGAAAVAAALVGGVLVGGVLLAGRGGHDGRTAKPAAPAPGVVTRPACATALPTTLRAGADNSIALDPGYTNVRTWGATSDGSAVIVYDHFGESPTGLVKYVGLVAPGSSEPNELARITTRTHSLGVDVAVADGTVLVTVEEGINAADRSTRIFAIDAATGVVHVIADSAADPALNLTGAAAVLDGHVYWSTSAGRGPKSDRIHDTDLATGRSSVIARGVFDLRSSAAGVMWSVSPERVDRPGHLPSTVAGHVRTDTWDSFVTDGSSYAWQDEAGAIEWWGAAARDIVRVPGVLARPYSTSDPGTIQGVAGPLVIYTPPHGFTERVLDTRTGATVPLPAEAGVTGNDGVLVGILGGEPRYRLVRVDTTHLPEVRC